MATGKVGKLYVEIGADDKPLQDKLKAAEKAAKEVDSQVEAIHRASVENLSKLGNKLTLGLTVPLAAGAAAALNYASDLEETLSKVDVVFGGNADSIKDWASTAVEQMGLAEETALSAAATYGNMADGMGLTADQGAEMAKSLTQLSADLASFNNTSQETAQIALNSIFTGETETLKQYGIVMTEANLEQFAMQQGLSKTVSEMNQAEKVQLRYNYVLANTTNAQGDFARTSDSVANQTRMAKEQLKQAAAALGQNLVPAAASTLKVINNILSGFQKLNPAQQKMILDIAGIAAAAGPVIKLGTGAYSMVQKLDKALIGLQMSRIAKEVNKFGESTTAAAKGLDLITAGAKKSNGEFYTTVEILSHNTAELKKFGIEGDQAAKVLQATATTSAATGAGISGVGTASAAAQPAVKSFGLTLNSALSFVGLAVPAVSLLVGVFNGLGKETSASAKQIEADTDAMVSSMEEVTESAASLQTEYDESIAKVDSMAEEAGKLVDEYYSLADGTDKSEDSQKRMKEIVGSLSGRFDSLSGYIDENTGLLNANRETIEKSIDAQLDYNRALANREYRVETTEAYSEAVAKEAAAKKMLADNEDKLASAQRQRDSISRRLVDIDGKMAALQADINDGNAEAIAKYDELSRSKQSLLAADTRLLETGAALTKNNKELDEGSEELAEAIEKLNAERQAAAELEKEYFQNVAASFEAQIEGANNAAEAYTSFSETEITAMKDILASGIELDDATREHFVNAIQMNEEEVAAIEEGSSRITAAKAKELEARKLAGEELTQIEQAQLDRYKEIQDARVAIATNTEEKISLADQISLQKRVKNMQDNQKLIADVDANLAHLRSLNDDTLNAFLDSVDTTSEEGMSIIMQLAKDSQKGLGDTTREFLATWLNGTEQGFDDIGDTAREGSKEAAEAPAEELSPEKAEQAYNAYFDSASNTIRGKSVALESQMRIAVRNVQGEAEEIATSGSWAIIGINMIDGIRRGIQSRSGALNSAMRSVINSAVTAAKKAGEIHSPSRLFEREVGAMMSEGMAKGIADKTDAVSSALREQVLDAAVSVNPIIFREVGTEVPSISNRFGGITVNVPISVSRSLSDADIQKKAETISRVVGREFAKMTGGRMS